jgi:hypothetical protein
MTNEREITLEQLFKAKAPWGVIPLQDVSIPLLEADIKENGYQVAMKRDREWYQTWKSGGKQPIQQSEKKKEEKQQIEWHTKIQALNLSQPDASTCQSACIAMAMRDPNIYGIRKRLIGMGQAGDPAVMGRVMRSFGVKYIYEENATLANVASFLRQGEFLITHGWFTGSGHVICLDGVKDVGGKISFNVKDPWSEFDGNSWSYNKTSKFYDGYYSDRIIYAACVAGTSRNSAASIYKNQPVNYQQGGMWVHRIIP